ncbi:MAG: hypothetical protein E6H09_20145, partial [Bacteroidetes bacterium]
MDVSLLPSSVTIPANDSVVSLTINAIADLITEPFETLKIYVSNSCATLNSDSLSIEIRDVDMLAITPTDSTVICRNSSLQLNAVTGYLSYSWTNGATLSNNNVNNPIATPIGA